MVGSTERGNTNGRKREKKEIKTTIAWSKSIEMIKKVSKRNYDINAHSFEENLENSL